MWLSTALPRSLGALFLLAACAQGQNWPQGSGPNGNWKVAGENPPTTWSATTGENILWRTPLPESGQGSAVVWGDRLFVTSNLPWKEGDAFEP